MVSINIKIGFVEVFVQDAEDNSEKLLKTAIKASIAAYKEKVSIEHMYKAERADDGHGRPPDEDQHVCKCASNEVDADVTFDRIYV